MRQVVGRLDRLCPVVGCRRFLFFRFASLFPPWILAETAPARPKGPALPNSLQSPRNHSILGIADASLSLCVHSRWAILVEVPRGVHSVGGGYFLFERCACNRLLVCRSRGLSPVVFRLAEDYLRTSEAGVRRRGESGFELRRWHWLNTPAGKSDKRMLLPFGRRNFLLTH
jgi:hypothetical protein